MSPYNLSKINKLEIWWETDYLPSFIIPSIKYLLTTKGRKNSSEWKSLANIISIKYSDLASLEKDSHKTGYKESTASFLCYFCQWYINFNHEEYQANSNEGYSTK